MYGNPETTPGGRALKFFSSVRLDVRRGEVIKNGTELIGNKTKVKVVKNKIAPPFKTPNLIFCTARVFQKKVIFLTLQLKTILSRSQVLGSAITVKKSVKAVTM